jgi:hypothetical protein
MVESGPDLVEGVPDGDTVGTAAEMPFERVEGLASQLTV